MNPSSAVNTGLVVQAFKKVARITVRWVVLPLGLVVSSGVGLYSAWYLGNRPTLIALAILSLFSVISGLTFYLNSRAILAALKEVERERDRAWSPQVETERMQLQRAIEAIPELGGVELDASRASEDHASDEPMNLYIRGIELENIRCFNRLGLAFEDDNGSFLTTILLGDNAAGKSTILRSIALGLCPESDSISLMKELSGTILRKGESRGSITLHVRSADRGFSGSIRTTIEQSSFGEEVVRQVTDPPDFPWNQIFVCGYGTHRSSGRPSSHQKYVAREAVRTLFSDSADLLNPEIVLLRRDQKTRQQLERILKQILLLEQPKDGIHTSNRGVELGGPWGTQPIAAVSDGYRSTSQWVLDYLGWELFANRFRENRIDGILLIDELEQHLHPRWQRYLVQRLRAQLGATQIIASSHTPLLASGVADVRRSQVVRLIPLADGSVETVRIPTQELTGKRADQILADAFGLITSKSPGSIAKIDRYTELLSKKTNEHEQQELEKLKQELADTWSSGDHALTREADKAVSKVLDTMLSEGREREIVDAQIRQRLKMLFDEKE